MKLLSYFIFIISLLKLETSSLYYNNYYTIIRNKICMMFVRPRTYVPVNILCVI